MKIMDCTLRDGANVVGDGFSAELTTIILRALTENNVPIIEIGNAKGLGAFEISNSVRALTDEEYLILAQPFLAKSEFGMFLNAKRFRRKNVELAAKYGFNFLRIGADAGDCAISEDAIRCVKENGMKVYYALMKAYLSSPEELAEEAHILQEMGVNVITIMDSAGTMWPQDAAAYTRALKSVVNIPIGFHGHNNMHMALSNCVAATNAGADIIDCCLLGMARSAGNICTEAAVAVMNQQKIETGIDFYGLLHSLDEKLIPAMRQHGYHVPIEPLDLILGYSGCHSSFVPRFKQVADETQTDLYELIVQVSAINKKTPNEALIRQFAEQLKKQKSTQTINGKN